MNISTIGFTKTTAENFFSRLKTGQIRRVIDVRLNNTSQLAGFAKADDLRYFLRSLCGIDYVHWPFLAPTQDILDAFKKQKAVDWRVYEDQFLSLMATRRIEDKLKPDQLDGNCLLCSEDKPHHCHRRLVAEYLSSKWSIPVSIRHL